MRNLSRLSAVLAILAGLVGPGWAQVCDRIADTPLAAFRDIDARGAEFIMAVGGFRGGEVVYEERVYGVDGTEALKRRVAGRFIGHAATRSGFLTAIDAPVHITQWCLGDECKPETDGRDYLVFMTGNGSSGYVFDESASCAIQHFPNPSPELLDRMIACLNGGCD